MDNGDKFLRQKAVADLLGVSRHTLARIIKNDLSFPRFIEISAGIHVVRQRQVQAWIRGKELEARERGVYEPPTEQQTTD